MSEKSLYLITEHGRPSACLVDIEDYEALQVRLQILEGIARRESTILDGNILDQDEAEQRISRWLG